MNRVVQNEDLFKMLIVSSDPNICSFRMIKSKKSTCTMLQHMDNDVRSLIELYHNNVIESDSKDDSDNSESFSD
jgi:hypothetical protein